MKTSKTSGFTLIELLVAIAVFGILIGLAAPQLHNFMRDNRMTSQFNNFVTALQLTRSEAVRRNAHVILCGSSNQTTCNTSAWESGWIIFVDGTNDYFTNPGGRPSSANKDIILKVGGPLGGNDTLRDNLVNNTNAIGYVASGATDSANPTGTFTLCDPGDASDPNNTVDRQKRALAVNITNTGFISQATDTSNDGIVNDYNGTDVTCP